MISRVLERLCTMLDHRIGSLCDHVVRDDAAWRYQPPAGERHRELRARYLAGMDTLPYPQEPGAPSPTAAVRPPARRRRSKSA